MSKNQGKYSFLIKIILIVILLSLVSIIIILLLKERSDYFSKKVKCSEIGKKISAKLKIENENKRKQFDFNDWLDNDQLAKDFLGYDIYRMSFYSPKLNTCLVVTYNTAFKVNYIDDVLINYSVGFGRANHIGEFSEKNEEKYHKFVYEYSEKEISL